MSSRNSNNNSNSTSVAADQAPGDDEEGVEGGDAEAVEAEQGKIRIYYIHTIWSIMFI